MVGILLDSVVKCEALVIIPSGHIHYQVVDTTVVRPGDVAEYSCDTLYKLQGDHLRICLRNGTWSGAEPVCIGWLFQTRLNRTTL